MAHSGLFEQAYCTSAFGGNADTPCNGSAVHGRERDDLRWASSAL